MKLLLTLAAFFWTMTAVASAAGPDSSSTALNAIPASEVKTVYLPDGNKDDTYNINKAIRSEKGPRGFTLRDDDPDSPTETPALPETSPNPQDASALLGINCRGSGRCISCNTGLNEILYSLDSIADNTYFPSGQKIVCRSCQPRNHCKRGSCEGLCVFVQRLQRDRAISAQLVKQKVRELKAHGCHRCGSAPIFPGNDVNDGEITVNFVYNGCGDGVCSGE